MKTRKIAETGRYLTFNLNGRLFGVLIQSVREINQMSDITPIPQTPPFIAGVMNLRGKVIPVVNLRAKFEMPKMDYSRETCIVVIESNAGQVGAIVDSVSGVVSLGATDIEPTPALGAEDKINFVCGIGKLENQVVILIDIVDCLSKENLGKFANLRLSA